MRDGFVIFALYSPLSPISPVSPLGDTPENMKRATMTLPDDLAEAVDRYVKRKKCRLHQQPWFKPPCETIFGKGDF